MRIGQLIRKWRQMMELDLRTVANQIGISYPTLMRIEKGHEPEGRTLAKLIAWMCEPVKKPKE